MSVLTLATPVNSAATAGAMVSSASASTPAVSSWVTEPVPRAASAVGPSSSKDTRLPMSTWAVSTSSSPSVTVTVANSAPLARDTTSSGSVSSSCQSEAYWARLSTPLSASMATAKAAAPVEAARAVAPMRPTTRSPSLNRKIATPSVVVRPESVPSSSAMSSEKAVVPSSSSWPKSVRLSSTTEAEPCA
ncbi:hypothetical protein D3C81_1504340 [compost metagenome]